VNLNEVNNLLHKYKQ